MLSAHYETFKFHILGSRLLLDCVSGITYLRPLACVILNYPFEGLRRLMTVVFKSPTYLLTLLTLLKGE